MADDPDIEDLQLELQISLCQTSMDVVKAIAERLGIEQAEWKEKKSQMVAMLCKSVDGELEKKESDAQRVLMLQDLIGRCKDMTLQNSVGEQPGKEVEIVEDKTHESPKKPDTVKGKPTPADNTPYFGLTSALRRQFKIIGQIGEPNQKDKLSYTSLVRQIEAGVDQGFTEEEVRDGVIRAISPGMVLRSYLETFSDLTLNRLRKIIRSHYGVKDTTEMYQNLASLCQGPKESPQAFLIRALELRQKILFASDEDTSVLKYDKDHIQKLFLRTVETGLQDESIRAKLRPYLKDTNIMDEDLIQQLNAAVSSESERSRKLKSQPKSNSKTSGQTSQVNAANGNTQPPPDAVMAAIKEIKSEVESLRAKMKEPKTSVETKQQNQRAPRKPLCVSCQESGQTSCTHCFICGADNHFAAGCRKRPTKASLNGRRLLKGGRQ